MTKYEVPQITSYEVHWGYIAERYPYAVQVLEAGTAFVFRPFLMHWNRVSPQNHARCSHSHKPNSEQFLLQQQTMEFLPTVKLELRKSYHQGEEHWKMFASGKTIRFEILSGRIVSKCEPPSATSLFTSSSFSSLVTSDEKRVSVPISGVKYHKCILIAFNPADFKPLSSSDFNVPIKWKSFAAASTADLLVNHDRM